MRAVVFRQPISNGFGAWRWLVQVGGGGGGALSGSNQSFQHNMRTAEESVQVAVEVNFT